MNKGTWTAGCLSDVEPHLPKVGSRAGMGSSQTPSPVARPDLPALRSASGGQHCRFASADTRTARLCCQGLSPPVSNANRPIPFLSPQDPPHLAPEQRQGPSSGWMQLGVPLGREVQKKKVGFCLEFGVDCMHAKKLEFQSRSGLKPVGLEGLCGCVCV